MAAVGVAKAVVKFKLDDRRLTLDYKKVPFNAWSELKRVFGMTPKTLLDALGDMDVEAFVAIIWLERKQRERKLSLAEVVSQIDGADEEPEFQLLDLIVEGTSVVSRAHREDDDQADDAEDPTSGS